MAVASQEQRAKTAQKMLDPANNFTYLDQTYFLETCPISPPHGYFVNSMATKKATPRVISTEKDQFTFEKMKITDVLDKIAYIKFRPVTNNTEGQPGAITFSTTLVRDLKTTGERAGMVPCWFLPWYSAKIIQMSIPDVNTAQFTPPGYDPIPNPRLFFTAAINGCSVFAYGNPRSPRVAHAGINGALRDCIQAQDFQSLGGESHQVWRNLLEGIKVDGTGRVVPKTAAEHKSGTLKQNRAGGSFGEVSRLQYVSRLKPNGNFEAVTNESDAFEKYLEKNRTGYVTKVQVNPFGCVFGLRNDGGAWAFTLQRNACVSYHRVYVKKSLFSKAKTVSHGPDKKTPDLLFYSAVNLGFTRFFPQPSLVHYHAKESIQIY
ncbi:MAG: hypothetical protein HY000_39015 [Planctomycetes bacterium]|nr:hypothetical protein [Planctomycetota bacterium]